MRCADAAQLYRKAIFLVVANILRQHLSYLKPNVLSDVVEELFFPKLSLECLGIEPSDFTGRHVVEQNYEGRSS